MNITLNQLRAFERIVRLGSFSSAAKELRLTQPSISQRIRELESALDTSLFVRNGPRITPTAEAHALLAYADRVLETETEMRERFRSRDPLRGLLRIGVSENFALLCLADMFRRLEERYPAITASVFVSDSGTLSHRLEPAHARPRDRLGAAWSRRMSSRFRSGSVRLGWFAHARHGAAASSADTAPAGGPSPDGQSAIGTNPWDGDEVVRRRGCDAGTREPVQQRRRHPAGDRRWRRDRRVACSRIMQDDLERRHVRLVETRPSLPAHRVAICFQHSESGPALQAFVELMRGLIAQHLPVRQRRTRAAGARHAGERPPGRHGVSARSARRLVVGVPAAAGVVMAAEVAVLAALWLPSAPLSCTTTPSTIVITGRIFLISSSGTLK